MAEPVRFRDLTFSVFDDCRSLSIDVFHAEHTAVKSGFVHVEQTRG